MPEIIKEDGQMAMAVKGIDGLELLQLLQISKADIDWLKKCIVEVSVLPTEIKIWSPGHGIQVSVPVKLAHLTQLKQGQLGALAKQSLRLMVQAQIKQVEVKLQSFQDEFAEALAQTEPAELEVG